MAFQLQEAACVCDSHDLLQSAGHEGSLCSIHAATLTVTTRRGLGSPGVRLTDVV